MSQVPSIVLESTRPAEDERSAVHPACVRRVRLRAQRLALWMRKMWEEGLVGSEQGMAITHTEVRRLLTDPAELRRAESAFYEDDETARRLHSAIEEADEDTRADETWAGLVRCFDLTEHESDLLQLATAVDIDSGLRRVYAYLHDDVQATSATRWLAARLFEWPDESGPGPESNLTRWLLARPIESAANIWSVLTSWLADPAVTLLAQTGKYYDNTLGQAVVALPAWQGSAIECIHPYSLAEMRAFADAMRESGTAIEIELIGVHGIGKRTLALQFASAHGRNLVAASGAALLAGQTADASDEKAIRVLRMARAAGAISYWQEMSGIEKGAWRPRRATGDIVIIGRESTGTASQATADIKAGMPSGGNDIVRQIVTIQPLDSRGRESLWSRLTDAPVPVAIKDRRLTAGEIALIARAARGGQETIRQTFRAMVEPPNEMVEALPCPYTWEDLVLGQELRAHLKEFEQQARLRWPVYEEWGFGRLCPLGKGVSALFAGPSGTGKTMAAQVIARELELELYRVDLAGVVNKYIGETEKRLKQVFDRAERSGVLLFFDEADALFGKRMQVKDAHDRFANIEIDYLLQRMERFEGIAVLATNRKNDLDTAFLRRIRFLIDFLPPGPDERLRLWQRALLAESPSGEPLLEEIDWGFLAEKLTLTGAEIKNAALAAAFLSRGEGKRIGMGHILAAVRREMAKQGLVLRVTFPERS